MGMASGKSLWTGAVIKEKDDQAGANLVRMPETLAGRDGIPITSTCHIRPCQAVYSFGRTSDLQLEKVRSIPTFMDGKMNGTEKETHEWTVERFDEEAVPKNGAWEVLVKMGTLVQL